MIFTVLAGRCLANAAQDVERPLRAGDLAASREKLSWIVGRDTSQLQPQQINRAVVETVAENTVDGIIAPLFFLLLGGAPLAMAYKAVNTLDSMVGYKHEKYRAIGMVSARLDDVANIIPARLSWLLIGLAAFICRDNGARALRIGWRDRKNHSSPNCAWSEATVAGALLFGVVFNLLNFENGRGTISLSAHWQSVIRGLFLLVVILLQVRLARPAAKK